MVQYRIEFLLLKFFVVADVSSIFNKLGMEKTWIMKPLEKSAFWVNCLKQVYWLYLTCDKKIKMSAQ